MATECEHAWVYESAILCSYPPQRRRICKNCGKKETIICGVPIPPEDTYPVIVDKFTKRGN